MAKKCKYCGEMATKPHNHNDKIFPTLKGTMQNYDEFFGKKRKKPNHCTKCGEHYRSEWHMNFCPEGRRANR